MDVDSAYRQIPGVSVIVDNVMYVPNLEGTPEKPYTFVYFITIANRSPLSLTVRGRKWVVTEKDGSTVVVEGEGVVGEKPFLRPGENFSYNSAHVVAFDAEAHGAMFGVTETGELFSAPIPHFEMKLPVS